MRNPAESVPSAFKITIIYYSNKNSVKQKKQQHVPCTVASTMKIRTVSNYNVVHIVSSSHPIVLY